MIRPHYSKLSAMHGNEGSCISGRGSTSRPDLLITITWLLALICLGSFLITTCYADDPGEISGQLAQSSSAENIPRKYMYWLIVAGSAAALMTIVTAYVLFLNHILWHEIRVRQKSETALRESMERFEHIVACSGDWIWETDVKGHYTYSSDMVKDMLGYNPQEVLGRPQWDFFTASEKERFLPRAEEYYSRKEKVFRKQYRLVTSEGRVVIHQSTAEPVLNKRGNLLGYRGVNRDVTRQFRFVQL